MTKRAQHTSRRAEVQAPCAALVLVDIQNDFLPAPAGTSAAPGALAVPDGLAVVPVANDLLRRFEVAVATQDWHPPGHASFASQHPGRSPGEVVDLDGLPQVLWPDHCVQGTPGASFASALDVARLTAVFRKGTRPRVDSYSGFFDNGKRHDTGLDRWLRDRGIDELWVMGLATDYCVKWTALDAARLGFRVVLVPAGCRGVELRPGDCQAALDEMRTAGVRRAEVGEA
ncbi:MAG: bifunctional nicotinamidase/pyrazinamidase [Myxococcota bacterium]